MVSALVAIGPALSGLALEGEPYIHDPSTIVTCDGKFYTFGTGSGGLISDDGWTWRSGAVRPGGGAAPDVIKLGDRYLVAYGATGGGLGGFGEAPPHAATRATSASSAVFSFVLIFTVLARST